MVRRTGVGIVLSAVAVAIFATLAVEAHAQSVTTNPYRPIYGWGELPEGRVWGSTSAIHPAADGNIWVAERCGANTCVGSDLDPILLFGTDGNLIRSFGAGLVSWPHGMEVDSQGSVWVTDAYASGAETTGHTVLKFSPQGELLMTLGTPGVAGNPPASLTRPSDVLVAPNGEIYVVDAHGAEGINRIVKYAADGTYLDTWGETGYGPLQFRDPHALAMDSQGRIFVGDRANNRIQVLDQEGNFIAIWTQFGRPSGIFIDEDDRIYVADSESSPASDEFWGMRNAGWEKGIRVGSARTGWVDYFIPDTQPNVNGYSGPEGIAVDAEGNLYGAEVSQRQVVKHVRFRE
ncbi:MAG: peptidyl-alpha-hydroxyglycine alpha-amidating lyase family protein [Gemmatimonadota bacterium]